MLTYNDLTKSQKKSIDTLVEFDPTLKSVDTIERPRLEEIFFKIRETNAKYGYPSFITRNNKISRGVYAFPGPDSKPYVENEDLSAVNTAKPKDEFEEEFLQEMKECGII